MEKTRKLKDLSTKLLELGDTIDQLKTDLKKAREQSNEVVESASLNPVDDHIYAYRSDDYETPEEARDNCALYEIRDEGMDRNLYKVLGIMETGQKTAHALGGNLTFVYFVDGRYVDRAGASLLSHYGQYYRGHQHENN